MHTCSPICGGFPHTALISYPVNRKECVQGKYLYVGVKNNPLSYKVTNEREPKTQAWLCDAVESHCGRQVMQTRDQKME